MKILTQNIEKPNSHTLQGYGEYRALGKALKMKTSEVIEEMKKSKLVGRGGASFPTGLKWDFASRVEAQPKYLLVNADEGEPGTFKDKVILEQDPHRLLEGMIIAGYAIGAVSGTIYLRAEYPHAYEILEGAIAEAQESGFLGDDILGSGFSFRINVARGAGAYVCGEETALIESIEGFRGNPRLKPPYPTVAGFRQKPTVINNVETISNVPTILEKGGEWFSKIGSPQNPGTKLMSVSGFVNKPGVYEIETGMSLRTFLDTCCGGVVGKFKAVLPGGLSTHFLTDLDVALDVPSMNKAGSSLGSGAVIVLNETADMVDVSRNCLEFFCHESCGKCTPCREGTKQALDIVERLAEGEEVDLGLLSELYEVMKDTAICGLGQAALNPVMSAIEKFRPEFDACVR
ncbi:MAG TPA: NADH-quinone oxidoreductase subunit NuoF [Chroococcales cyanobacterium]